MRVINWIQLVLGVVVLISPWVFGFADIVSALWGNVILGALVAIFALWQLFGGGKQQSPLSS